MIWSLLGLSPIACTALLLLRCTGARLKLESRLGGALARSFIELLSQGFERLSIRTLVICWNEVTCVGDFVREPRDPGKNGVNTVLTFAVDR